MTPRKQFLAFVAVALAGAAVQLAVLWLFAEQLNVPEIPAFWAGWLAGWGHNFAWHRNAIFVQSQGPGGTQALRGLVAALAGLAVQTIVFASLTGIVPLLIAGAIAAACSLPVTFLLTRHWAFGYSRLA